MKYWWDKLDYDEIDDPDYNQANVKKLYELLSDGVSVEDACADIMIKPEQYYDWLEKSEGFRMLMRHALATYRINLQRQLARAAIHNPTYALKALERVRGDGDIYEALIREAMKRG